MRKKRNLFLMMLASILLISFFYVIRLGAVEITYRDILNIITYRLGLSDLTVSKTALIIIEKVRLPRVIMAILVGSTLATAGAAMQALYQNPMADPYIIGISSSASLGAVLAFFLNLSPGYYGLFAFFLSLITASILYQFSRVGKRSSVIMLLLLGIGLSAFFGSITSFLIYFAGEDSFAVIIWLNGYLGDANWQKVSLAFVPIILGILILNWRARDLNMFLTGEEEAYYLGVDVELIKKIILGISTLIVAISVAYGGIIGFVGLVIPHILRLLIGNDYRYLLPLSSLGGAIFLLFSDTIARTIIAPIEIPIGIITSAIGAPFFIYLLLKRRKVL